MAQYPAAMRRSSAARGSCWPVGGGQSATVQSSSGHAARRATGDVMKNPSRFGSVPAETTSDGFASHAVGLRPASRPPMIPPVAVDQPVPALARRSQATPSRAGLVLLVALCLGTTASIRADEPSRHYRQTNLVSD